MTAPRSHIVIGESFNESTPNLPVLCLRDNSTAHFHSTSWSCRFTCPTCGKSRRYNTNFLGNKYEVVCNGQKIARRMKAVWVERLAART